MRALALVSLLAGCGFSRSGGAGDDPDAGRIPTIDAGEVPTVDAGIEPPDATPPITCETPWVDEETGCHLYVKDATAAFDAAQADCQTQGGHLAVENKPGEADAIAAGMAPLGADERFWIGLHDPLPDDNVFVWINGAVLAVSEENWAETEPSNTGDCVNARPNGTWGDRSCDEPKFYACEKND